MALMPPREGMSHAAAAGQLQYMPAMQRIESRFPVDQWTIDGFEVWPLIRIFGLFASPAILCGASAPGRLQRLLALAGREAASACSAFRASCRSRTVTAGPLGALLFSDGVSYIRPDRGSPWYDRFCDPLCEHLDQLGRRHATIVSGRARMPLARPAHFIHNHLRLALLRAPGRRGRAELPGFAEAAIIMRNEIGWQPTMRWLESHIRRIHAYAWWYGTLLDRLRPRSVFLVSYYSAQGFALLHAAHRRNITTIDIQHGAQGDIHPAYAHFASAPAAGWDLLPRRFWVWSETEAQAISGWGLPDHAADVVGNVMLDRRLIGLGCAAIRPDAPETLLITLQPYFDDAGYYRLLSDVIAGLPTGMRVWIRAHPAQLDRLGAISARFGSLGSRCSIVDASLTPLYDLLPQVSVHLTHSSSTVIEAAALGIPSVLLDPLGAALYAAQCSAGQAVHAATPEGITAQIVRLSTRVRTVTGIDAAAQRQKILVQKLDDITRPRGPSAA